ncbi:hypothetical protein KSP40_PGU004184 [Platanthera guangdongensis]|uniref:Uncharacterized protein n=1 Tax=Platanthera guangdongensis TaxID=2320717 RepID=A0ABR2N256_9ASPA
MGSGMWKKVKVALGLNLCVFEPRTRDQVEIQPPDPSKALLPSSSASGDPAFRLSKSGSRSSKKTCAICLGNMKAGRGALFTAECSHTFHFSCISSNVRHGNRVCPICRARWKEVPFLDPSPSDHGGARVSPVGWPHDDGTITLLRRLHLTDLSNRRHHGASLSIFSEPNAYDDDEPLLFLAEADIHSRYNRSSRTVDIKAFPEYSAIAKMAPEENFSILIHLKASSAAHQQTNPSPEQLQQPSPRASADLVTVLDISGSMAGTKLALLKQAMGFVIHNLGPCDRLSVVAFSSTARRLFPLRRMTEAGKRHALQSVHSLMSGGGTNIAEGLRKAAMVIQERRETNPVCSIILLSDGQDTYLASSRLPDYQSLVPSSIRGNSAGHHLPIHAFGFGADHDSVSMHSISETSCGTFSFIESERAIQDSFAQCIGGLLSVAAQELVVEFECSYPGVRLATINSGSYTSQVVDPMKGSIRVGDLYADEERDFLVSVDVPPSTEDEIALLKVGCSYKDPLSKETVDLIGEDVRVQRPVSISERSVSVEVDREKNRVWAAEAMVEARAAAEQGALSEAVSVLEARRVILSESLAGRSGDPLCISLDAEMKEMQERMESRQRYEESGRAYVLSGLSSHSWQRATARGGSTDSTSLVHSYQTPSMVDMLQRSQTFSLTPRPSIRPAGLSFQYRLNPR